MKDYDIFHKDGMIIGNLKASSLREAKKQAKAIYGPTVKVELT